jgi:acyl transferase domain-containing protein
MRVLYGFGGTLAHLVVAQALVAGAPRDRNAWSSHLITLSAQNEPALDAMTEQLAKCLQANPDLTIGDVAYTLQTGRNAFGWRRILACGSREEAVLALTAPQLPGSTSPLTSRVHHNPPAVAFMFPGQGAQKLRMAQALYQEIKAFRAIIDDCAKWLQEHTDFDLISALYPADPVEDERAQQMLNATKMAQPALFVVEYAVARMLIDTGIKPNAMIGHSLGEYVAACLSGVFSLNDALMLVARRGAMMQALAPGAMLGVSLDETSLRSYLDDEVSLAAINGPKRCVVSGAETAIAELEQRLTERSIGCRRLPTSHAFHSPMMEPIVAAFTSCVATIPLHEPVIPFISDVSGTWISAAEATDPAYWARQLRAPVRFSTGLATLTTGQDHTLIEVGPGQALCTMARQRAGADTQKILPTLGRDGSPSVDLSEFLKTHWPRLARRTSN